MSDNLKDKVCVPCQGGIPPLTSKEANSLLNNTPGWELKDDATKLYRSFSFDNFKTALNYINKVGIVSEEEGHHPDIEFGWGYVNITILTHKIGGLHENDFILAAKIDEIE